MRTGLIALIVAAAAGSASAVVVSYDFETGLAAQGWTATTNNAPTIWQDLPGLGDGNYVNTSNNAPIANNDLVGPGFGGFDTSLTSAALPFVGAATLSYQLNFQSFSGLDFCEVYYGNTLVNIHTTDVGVLYGLNTGVGFTVPVVAAAGDKVRFRFSTTDTDPWEWYAQVDNVSIDGQVPAPASLALVGLGGLVAGRRRR